MLLLFVCLLVPLFLFVCLFLFACFCLFGHLLFCLCGCGCGDGDCIVYCYLFLGHVWDKKTKACSILVHKYLATAARPFPNLRDKAAFYNTDCPVSSVHSLACHDGSVCVESVQLHSILSMGIFTVQLHSILSMGIFFS